MADSENTRIVSGANRRTFLKGAAAASIAATVLPTLSAESATHEPSELFSGIEPSGPSIKGYYFSMVDEDAEMPLTVLLEDGTCRPGTDAELAAELMKRPGLADQVAPHVLRRILPDHDGEFYALQSEERELVGQYYDTETHQYREGYREAKAAIFKRLCECPIETDQGAAARLRIVFSDTYNHAPQLTDAQQRQLLWGAMDWLYRSHRDVGAKIERRPIVDRTEATNGLLTVARGAEYFPSKSEAEIREIKRQAYLGKAEALATGEAA